MKKNVLWVYYERNWAYDINAKILAANLPQYNHHFFITGERNRNDLDLIISNMHIIISMNPMNYYLYNNYNNVFSILDSVRAIKKSTEEVFAKMAGVICTNNDLFEFAKTKNKNILLQPNGIDLNVFQPSVIQRNFKKFTVGFAGNVGSSYNIDYKGWSFYQEAVNSLADKVEQLNAKFGSTQIPFDKMVSKFYHKIDCLILPSINEGCSNVIAEALACGVPVICTKVGYHGDESLNQGQCIYVDRNAASIKTAILQLYENPSLYKYMKKAARDFACQYHDIKKVAKNYADFFERSI